MVNSCDMESESEATDETFIKITVALKESGVPVKELKLSSKLEPLLINYKGVILNELGKIAPEVLPPVVIEETLIQKSGTWIILLGLGIALINSFFKYSIILTSSFILFTCGFLIIVFTSRMKPKSIKLGSLETFGDLCTLINNAKINEKKHTR